MDAPRVVVAGVSGCGKSTVGAALAARLGLTFVDGDDYHSAANIAKMAAGTPLDDADRADWLDRIAARLAQPGGLVLACSALRRRYRDRLRAAAPGVIFVFLEGDYATIARRLSGREGHFLTDSGLLQSQFEALEPPTEPGCWRIPVDQPPEAVLDAALAAVDRALRAEAPEGAAAKARG
ncbi:gluconokinase [Plastorhodobacter daqingensis]|uniref:Gluconokinase n=1 Tax=Plastorhodobacter daqingensis TaxID=1387281 RepID=A0ABW2UL55_9RHOB